LTSNQFYAVEIDQKGSTAFVGGDEHHHLARVARIRIGDEVWIFDDKRNRFLARVESVGKDRTRLSLIEAAGAEVPRVAINLGQALIKPKNMDIIVQKTTEIGIVSIIPLISVRSRPAREGEWEKKAERWRKIAREAAKQSRQPATPLIEALQPLDGFAGREFPAKKFFLSENGGTLLREVITEGLKNGPLPGAVLLVTGPEGGWTRGEEEAFLNRTFERVSLGRTILRAETAAILSVGMISHFWNS
jgi:16S rRNA (uracil1498-N3)-methyltransferase